MDELHGILTTYEMRTQKEKLGLNEATLKASNKTNGHKDPNYFNCESNAEEAQSLRKIKKGFGIYKCKLPFKCFSCGKIVHFCNNH